MHDLDEDIELDKNKVHDIDVVIDRLIIREGIESRLAESMEQLSLFQMVWSMLI